MAFLTKAPNNNMLIGSRIAAKMASANISPDSVDIEEPLKKASLIALRAGVIGFSSATLCNHVGRIVTGKSVPPSNVPIPPKNQAIGSPFLKMSMEAAEIKPKEENDMIVKIRINSIESKLTEP